MPTSFEAKNDDSSQLEVGNLPVAVRHDICDDKRGTKVWSVFQDYKNYIIVSLGHDVL